MILHIDIETRSRVDIRDGLDRYSRCPDARVLMAAFCFDEGPVRLWDCNDPIPEDLNTALCDPAVKKMAWNARFEQTLMAQCLGFFTRDDEWIDPSVIVLTLGLPGALGMAGPALGLPAELCKSQEGGRLIRKFSAPRQATKSKPYEWASRDTDPEDWARFGEYCIQDVEAERAIWNIVKPFNLSAQEWSLWCLDGQINRRGAPIDLDLVEAAIEVDALSKEKLIARAREITGLENPNSLTQLMPWLRDRGYTYPSVDKDTVAKALADDRLPATVKECLQVRAQISKTSVAKYLRIQQSIGPDSCLRNLYQFAGAGRTGRWSGRLVQFQNLPRPTRLLADHTDQAFAIELMKQRDADSLEVFYDSVPDVLSSLLRATICAPEGKKLVVVDFSSIEVAVIAQLAHCPSLLQVFKDGKDPYKVFAAAYYGKQYEDVTKAERNFSKGPVLGCGFGLSAGEIKEDGTVVGLMGYAASMGTTMTQEQAAAAVTLYRETYIEIPDMWSQLETAAKCAVRDGGSHSALNDTVAFVLMKDCLRFRLPSGRCLNYWKPEIRNVETPWGQVKPALTYLGRHQTSGKVDRLSTRGPKIAENAVQAFARDILAIALARAESAGFEVIGHSHDEIIALAPDDRDDLDHARLAEVICKPIDWAPGLPLSAAGYSALRYRKD